MQADLSDAWALYQDVVAPAPVETGFVLASCLALWVVAYVADWAAFRLWVPFEATLPAGTLFLFTALLGADRGRAGPSPCTPRAARLPARAPHGPPGRQQPLGGRPARGRPPLAPHRGRRPRRGRGGRPASCSARRSPAPTRPASSIRAACATTTRASRSARSSTSSRASSTRPHVEVFTVRSPVRAYWRLTSLERFDGRIWASSGSYGDADGELPESVPTDVGQRDVRPDVHHRVAGGDLAAGRVRAARARRRGPRHPLRRGLGHADRRQRRDQQRRPRLPGDLGVTPHHPRRPRRPRRTRSPARSGIGSSSCPTASAPTVTPAGARDHRRRRHARPSRPCALQDHLRTFRTRSTCRPGHSENALEDFLFDDQGRVLRAVRRRVRGHGPVDRPPGPGRGRLHARRRGPGRTRPVPRARRVRPRLARGVHRRRRLGGVRAHARAAACRTPRPTPACRSSRPRRATPAASSPRRPPPPASTIPSGSPSTSVRRSRRRNVDGGRLAATRTSERRLRAGAPRAPPARADRCRSSLGVVLAVRRARSRSALLRWRRSRRRRARHPAPTQIELAWLESVEEAAIVGFQRAAERHLLRARPPPGRRAPRRRGRRVRARQPPRGGALYSADGADADDADVGLGGRRRDRGPPPGRAPPAAAAPPLARPAHARAGLAAQTTPPASAASR